MDDFVERFGEPDGNGGFVLSSARQSIITSLLSAGTFVYVNTRLSAPNISQLVRRGALAQAFTADRYGRKLSIFIWSAIFTIGTLIQTATEHSIAQITVGRFVAGLGVGAMSGTQLHAHGWPALTCSR